MNSKDRNSGSFQTISQLIGVHDVGKFGLEVGFGRIVGRGLGDHLVVDVVPVDLTTKMVGAGDHNDSG